MDKPATGTKQAFRFFDNREKYLLFVTTCSEKWAVAKRIGQELQYLTPRQPALNIFDAGMGDGTVLTRVLRDLHRRNPTVPFVVVGKEISLEDVRLSLEKMSDRFHEHPNTVLVVTNLYYSEAPHLKPAKAEAAARVNRWEIALKGNTAHEFDEQIRELQPLLNEGWQTRASEKTGNPMYVRPSILILYREDQKFILDNAIPKAGQAPNGYDLVIASQPYRARLPAEMKVKNVLKPLASALAPGGRMIVIQSTGRDPGMEIIRGIWPDEAPFQVTRKTLINALKAELGESQPDLKFDALSDDKSFFSYDLHAMPDELGQNIGTSTLMAAWNAAVYVAQIEDARLLNTMTSGDYIAATEKVLKEHDGLWFLDESFLITRDKKARS